MKKLFRRAVILAAVLGACSCKAPKFPQVFTIRFLLRYAFLYNVAEAKAQALLSLTPVEVFEAGPVGQPGYRLPDLIAQCDLDQAPPRDIFDWDRASPKGGELL